MAEFEAYALRQKKSYDASIDEVETLRKKHEALMGQLSEADDKVRELNRPKVHESFAVTKLTDELLEEYVEDIEVHPGNGCQDQLEVNNVSEGLVRDGRPFLIFWLFKW